MTAVPAFGLLFAVLIIGFVFFAVLVTVTRLIASSKNPVPAFVLIACLFFLIGGIGLVSLVWYSKAERASVATARAYDAAVQEEIMHSRSRRRITVHGDGNHGSSLDSDNILLSTQEQNHGADHVHAEHSTTREDPSSTESSVELSSEQNQVESAHSSSESVKTTEAEDAVETSTVENEQSESAEKSEDANSSEEHTEEAGDTTVAANDQIDPTDNAKPNGVTMLTPKSNVPDWFENPPDVVNNYPAAVVSSDASTSLSRTQRDAQSAIYRSCVEASQEFLRNSGNARVYGVPINQRVVQAAVQDSFTAEVETSQGRAYVVHYLLVFDRDFNAEVRLASKHADVEDRLHLTGAVSGMALVGVGFLYGSFSLLDRLKRRRKKSDDAPVAA